jgi:hypothetical protein
MPSSSAYIPSFSISNFAQSVSAPYTSFGAYASGVIDANGNLLKPESSIDPYEYFVIKLKKIFEELPTNYTKARLNSYMSAFQIFNEEAESFGIPENHFLMFVEGYLQGGLLLNEDMGAGMATGGSPGSLGTAQVVPNTGTVMGYDKPMDLPLFRRSPVEMFDVDHNEFQNFKNAKAWKHIPDSPTKKYLKRFQQRNPNGKMAIRTKKPDTDEHDLYWITYPAKNFMEECGFDNLDFLFEAKAGLTHKYNDTDDNSGEPAVATLTDSEELKSTGKKTMVSLTARTKKETGGKEVENASVLFGNTRVAGSNTNREQALLDGITKRLYAAGYKLKSDAKRKEDLGIGEYAIFKEGGRGVHSDIHVGMEHPEKKGTVHHLGIESGYNKKMQKQFLIPKGTRISLPKPFKKIGVQPTSSNVSTHEEEIDVGEELIKRGAVTGSRKRYGLWPTLEKLFPRTIERVKERFRKPAYSAVRTKSDDMSIIGHEGRVAMVHHRGADSIQRALSQKLMDQMGLHHTHELDELTFSRSPFYGGSKKKKGIAKKKKKK